MSVFFGTYTGANFFSFFSWGCDNPIYGKTVNPLNVELGPGGSSGGEAALIRSGGSIFGLGTDVGGSCRIPAHMCGIAGFKPTRLRLRYRQLMIEV